MHAQTSTDLHACTLHARIPPPTVSLSMALLCRDTDHVDRSEAPLWSVSPGGGQYSVSSGGSLVNMPPLSTQTAPLSGSISGHPNSVSNLNTPFHISGAHRTGLWTESPAEAALAGGRDQASSNPGAAGACWCSVSTNQQPAEAQESRRGQEVSSRLP